MKNLLLGIVLGGILTSLFWYFKDDSSGRERETNQNEKLSISDFIDTTLKFAGISNMIIDDSTAKEYIGNYSKDHDTARDSTISHSIYFDKGAVIFMAKYFISSGQNVQGLRVYNIQYNKNMDRETNNSHKHPKQQSILFVPTDMNKKPLWKEWDPSKISSDKVHILGALNHGELCPKICPQ